MEKIKNNNRKIIFVIGGISLLMVILGISIFFIIKNDSESENIPVVDENYTGYIKWDNLDNIKIKNGNKVNTSKKVKKEHKYDEYKFNDMKLYTKDDKVYIEFEITNIGNEEDTENYTVFIRFFDKNSEIIYFMPYSIPQLEVGESKKEEISLPIDATNSYDYLVEGFLD